MKRFVFAFAAILLFTAANAQPPAGDAKPGDWYGTKITPDGAIDIATLPATLDKESQYDGKIKAKIVDVCPKKGCWLKLQVNDSTTAFVKMKNYGFFLPTAAVGKTVVLDAEAMLKTTSVAELRHYAEDAKKSKEEIEAITQPKKEINLLARGITVVE